MEFKESDVKFAFYNPNDRANGWSFSPDIGVKATHLPTGLEARSGMDRTREMNTKRAMENLKVLVEKWNFPQSVHDSDCAMHNRGTPELLGPCDCSASQQSKGAIHAEIDLERTKADLAKGVIVSLMTWKKILDMAIALSAPVESKPLSIKVWQERARNDALEEAAKICDVHPDDRAFLVAIDIRKLKTNSKE